MSEFVGRIEWDAVELATDARESGTFLPRLDDVRIVVRKTLRWEKRLAETMTEEKGQVGPEKMQVLTQEVRREPNAEEVAEIWYAKYLQISPTYSVGYAEHCQAERSGFGFTSSVGLVQENPDSCGLTFSWDWFTVSGDGIACKLQEDGLIRIVRSQTLCGNEVTHMSFDSDVSLRIMRRSDPPKLDPDWRINVHRGSEIYWPSLVDGKLVANGIFEGA